jgi:hypothetical protein
VNFPGTSLANCLADDYQPGHRITKTGMALRYARLWRTAGTLVMEKQPDCASSFGAAAPKAFGAGGR